MQNKLHDHQIETLSTKGVLRNSDIVDAPIDIHRNRKKVDRLKYGGKLPKRGFTKKLHHKHMNKLRRDFNQKVKLPKSSKSLLDLFR